MVVRAFNIIFILFILLSCKSKKEDHNNDCIVYYNNYVDLRLKKNKEESLLELSKSIKCDSLNQDFRFEKVKYLVKLKKYTKAKVELNNLSKINNSYQKYFPMSALLDLKLNNEDEGNKMLKAVYSNIIDVNPDKKTLDLVYSDILLSAFFQKNERSKLLLKLEKDKLDNERFSTLAEVNRLIELYGYNNIELLYEFYGFNK